MPENDLKIFRLVRFSIKTFTMRPFLNQSFYKVSDFELIIFSKIRFGKKCIGKITLRNILPVKTTNYATCVHFKKHNSDGFFYQENQFVNLKFYRLSDLELNFFVSTKFELKFLQLVGFSNNFFETCEMYRRKTLVSDGKILHKPTA